MPGYLDDAGDAIRKVIRAFHGSPYDFDKFDASRIGTGEGAQAYGHGLYFAGNEAVARSYRDIVGQEELTRHQEELRSLLKQKSQAAMALQEAEIGYKNAVRNRHITGKTQEQIDQEWSARIADARAAMNQSHLAARDAAPRRQRGHMYEVEIGYPEEALLDYDRPFSTPAGVVGAEILRQDNPAAVSASALRAIQDGSWRMDSFAGRSPYETAAVELTRLAKTRRGAQALMDAGVPGVRYLDGQSRGAGQGTRNYVTFPGTEDAIKIIRKYGWLLPVTMAAGAAAEEQE